ncbi:hypothetical protein ACIQW5_26600 [Methylorubrum thiocyanatum]|uniref:hypothetical protein n=1 Tax=Methylorubrum thiocyanatum TaxID=47958 RepID=UPI00383B63F5
MARSGRARCAVPFCRRTAAEADGFRDQEFLCGAHWRLRPPGLRAEWREHNRKLRRDLVPHWRHPPGSPARLAGVELYREHQDLWARTRATCIEIAMG